MNKHKSKKVGFLGLILGMLALAITPASAGVTEAAALVDAEFIALAPAALVTAGLGLGVWVVFYVIARIRRGASKSAG